MARFQKSLLWEQALPAEDQLKINNNNLGIALSIKGDHEAALEFFDERTRRLEGRLKPDQEIALLNGRSYVCLQSGRFEEAITFLKKAMQLAEQSGALHPFSSIMGNLITALIKESRYAESLPLLQKILAFQERLGNHRDVAYNLLRQGSVYLTLGMGEKAKSCFQNGRSYLDESDKNLFLWYVLVDGYWEKEYGDQNRAMELFREMEQGAETYSIPEIQSWAVYAQADLAFEQKKHAECRALLTKVHATTQDKEFLARLHLLEAKIAAFEKGEDPEKLFAMVENECVTGHYREILWELYHDWGLSREKRQGPKAAIPLLEQGAHIVEAIVGSLPEEYRDRYLNQKMRKKLFQDLEHSRTVPIGGMASRIKGFFKEKLNRSSGH
ncbi:MAG: tetratricopeptide repeat protein [Deltaproteobacteria bacterium]|nr:tetratricopeptide repeat protein [Deltaproteobacteria bacterium]